MGLVIRFNGFYYVRILRNALSAETRRPEEIYRRKVEALDELKKSLLEKAFRGELINEMKLLMPSADTIYIKQEYRYED